MISKTENIDILIVKELWARNEPIAATNIIENGEFKKEEDGWHYFKWRGTAIFRCKVILQNKQYHVKTLEYPDIEKGTGQ